MRFAFPAVSLEGKAFWILQTAPISLRTLLWSKLWLNLIPLLILGELLVFLSNLLLQVPPWMMMLSLATIFLMTFGITAICVGVGALYPKFTFDHAAEIPTSFGGAICMIVSIAFIGDCCNDRSLAHLPSRHARIESRSIDGAGVLGHCAFSPWCDSPDFGRCPHTHQTRTEKLGAAER